MVFFAIGYLLVPVIEKTVITHTKGVAGFQASGATIFSCEPGMGNGIVLLNFNGIDMDAGNLEYIFDVVSRQLPAADVDCIMIGGHAVNHYGYSRATIDVDFMIAAADADSVRTIMRNAGFSNMSASENVIFFSHPDNPVRVDFLQVDSETMQSLRAEVQTVQYGGYALKVPSLKNLLAMKLFALKNGSIKREEKDFPDLVNLVIEHQLDLEADLHPLCNQYANDTIYNKLAKHVQELRNA